MTTEQIIKCNSIIHTATAATSAVGAGLAQLPCSDTAVITPIQLVMVYSLGAVFNMDLSEEQAKASLAAAIAGQIGRGLSQVLVGWIPGFGNVVNAVTAGVITEAIGWAVANDFERQSLAC